MSGLDLTLDPERQLRRFEVINGAGGRRHWSVDDKARIIAETLEPNAVISEVARRYGLRPQQVFAWRREARKQATSVQQDSPAFVPAVLAAAGDPRVQRQNRSPAPLSIPHESHPTKKGQGLPVVLEACLGA
ncbi:IS66-like element accessory protein TnpA [Mesorhizobium muleiense]|uniref:IS66-like element accessory protein TnpA n=1 Tax=Mesorhizobium muleiense TaxID=1004279 RepID=UPI001F392BF4|nr:transposase [Mesorhizobium muleiense]MCF6112221.1 transposase [Mesorhizobium muleiense]